ncbi:MAG: hypothetical protein H6806_04705 [Planctomycetes bacterium]|nr:hypothetical protein [Planctomycetota bacterium]
MAIASSLLQGRGEGGWVAGLNAKWGEGKTSVLNMVAVELARHPSALVLRFEPWQFRTSDELLPRFLEQLASTVRGPGGTRFRELARKIERYARHLSGELSFLPKWLAVPAKALLHTGSRLLYPSLEQQKAEIARELSRRKTPVVVLIDDLDRLAPSESCEMLRLVRLIADFPFVRYLIAYDEEVVARHAQQGGVPFFL